MSSLVPSWLTPITIESNSLIICCVPLWRRPHCLLAQFLSSAKMIASFWFGLFTQENIQMWFFQRRRNGQKWKVSSHLMQARNIQNKMILYCMIRKQCVNKIKTFDFIEHECSMKSANHKMSRHLDWIVSRNRVWILFEDTFFCPSGLKEALFYFRCLCDWL